MLNQPLSGSVIQLLRVLMTVTIAVFIGIRFVPARFRQTIGVVLTACYLAGIAAFVVYLLVR